MDIFDGSNRLDPKTAAATAAECAIWGALPE